MNAEQQEMVIRNEPLIYYIVNKMGVSYNEFEDVVSVGKIGLVKAALSFNPQKGIKFSTYASRCINNEILLYFRQEKKHSAVVISLESPIKRDTDGNELALADVISDSNDFREQIEAEVTFINAINFILNALSPIETTVTLYGISGIKQKEIAKKLNISQSYVSRIERDSHVKVREFLKGMQEFKPNFTMSVEDELYKITFPLNEIQSNDKIFLLLSRKVNSKKGPVNFRVNYNSKECIITVPSTIESFGLIAELIRKIKEDA